MMLPTRPNSGWLQYEWCVMHWVTGPPRRGANGDCVVFGSGYCMALWCNAVRPMWRESQEWQRLLRREHQRPRARTPLGTSSYRSGARSWAATHSNIPHRVKDCWQRDTIVEMHASIPGNPSIAHTFARSCIPNVLAAIQIVPHPCSPLQPGQVPPAGCVQDSGRAEDPFPAETASGLAAGAKAQLCGRPPP